VVAAESGSRRTKPASTSPTKLMNSPMPAAMAALSSTGTALNTAWRAPTATSPSTTNPLIITRPMACGQLITGAMVSATKVLIPNPVAIAKG
jgi:hypothetical protein